ncbi:hypothetical protein SHINM13_14590 [Flavobacterium ammonificans]|nr:hypothetical protein SHINM13_14590 [Flavobacterium ammonificans]
MLLSRHIRNSDYKFVNRWYINFNLNVSKMKKTFLSLGFVLISSFAMANTIEVKEEVVVNNLSKSKIVVVQGPGDNEGIATPCENMALDFYELLVFLDGGKDDIDLLNNLLSACH